MSKKNSGGPAFPVSSNEDIEGVVGHQDGPDTWQYPGITIRDYFAAKAMQAILAQPDSKLDIDGSMLGERLSGVSFMVADAMLAERNK